MFPGVCYCSNTELHHERFNRMGDVLQIQQAEFLKC